MEEKIVPVQPIRPIKEVRAVRPVKLLRRLRYRSELKKNPPAFRPEGQSQVQLEADNNSQNKAHYNPEHIGEHADFKA